MHVLGTLIIDLCTHIGHIHAEYVDSWNTGCMDSLIQDFVLGYFLCVCVYVFNFWSLGHNQGLRTYSKDHSWQCEGNCVQGICSTLCIITLVLERKEEMGSTPSAWKWGRQCPWQSPTLIYFSQVILWEAEIISNTWATQLGSHITSGSSPVNSKLFRVQCEKVGWCKQMFYCVGGFQS